VDTGDVENWLEFYGNAWVEGDAERIMDLFTSDAVYRETPYDAPMEGRAAIGKYWQDGAGDGQENVRFDAQVWMVQGSIAVAGWQANFTRKPTGTRVELDGVFRLEMRTVSKTLLCSRLDEWWHRREQ